MVTGGPDQTENRLVVTSFSQRIAVGFISRSLVCTLSHSSVEIQGGLERGRHDLVAIEDIHMR